MRSFSWFLVGIVAGALGCAEPGAFQCESDQSCASLGVPGQCQPNGYCSFGDPSCDSGQRYGEFAPDDLAESCVPVFVGSTGPQPEPASSTGAVGESTGLGGMSSGGDTTGGPILPTTGPVDGSTTTGNMGEESSSGDSGRPPCPTFFDDFEDGVIDPSWNVAHSENSSEVGGQLVMDLTPVETSDATGVQLFDQDLSSASVELELGILPEHPATQLSLLLSNPDNDRVSIVVQPQVLSLRHGLGGVSKEQLLSVELDPVAHRWIRFATSGTFVSFEASADGNDWTNLLEYEIAWSLEQTTINVLGTNWQPLREVESVSVETFRLCTTE